MNNLPAAVLSRWPEILSFSAFGLELRHLTEAEIPLLHYWRNHPDILPFMNQPKIVSQKVLFIWLRALVANKSGLAYFIYLNEKPVAFFELKNFDWDNSAAESGIFLFGRDFFGTGISPRIMLCREFILNRLSLDMLISRVARTNFRNKNFIEKTGARLCGQKGNFLIYHSDTGMRRDALFKIASAMGCKHEFIGHFNC